MPLHLSTQCQIVFHDIHYPGMYSQKIFGVEPKFFLKKIRIKKKLTAIYLNKNIGMIDIFPKICFSNAIT